MPHFAYVAIAPDGSRVSGALTEADEQRALGALARRGLVPVSLREGHHAGPWWSREVSLRGTAVAPQAEVEKFISGLATMLQAHMPLPATLAFCAGQTRHPAMRRAIETIRGELENGSGLGAAMRAAGPVFPARLVRLVALGEQANRLASVSAEISALLAREAQLRRELASALIYPALLLGMSVLVLAMVMFYLAPTLMPVFASAGKPAPAMISVLVALGDALRRGWPLVLTAGAATALGLWLFRKPVRRAGAAALFRAPGIGRYLRQRESLRLGQTVLMMLQSGARLPDALAAAGEAVTSEPFRALVEQMRKAIEAGETLRSVLRQDRMIDPAMRALLAVGEESDRLQPVLVDAVAVLEKQVNETLARSVKLLTPVFTLAIGVGVGGLILSTISAVLDLNDLAF